MFVCDVTVAVAAIVLIFLYCSIAFDVVLYIQRSDIVCGSLEALPIKTIYSLIKPIDLKFICIFRDHRYLR